MAKRTFLSFKPIAGTILGLAFATIAGVNGFYFAIVLYISKIIQKSSFL
ncbi:MAG: hypothetical protein LBD59_08960 [Prevotellaceae bacterium]|jgi:hypothetical protein|nr:hypothetical protein [Prevotellaceae bacterium]